MKNPRKYTEEEVRDTLMRRIKSCAKEWASYPDKTPQEIADGVAFSILAILDGCSTGCPGFYLYAAVHEDDEKYHKDRGENWIEPETSLASFHLHDHYHAAEPEEETEEFKFDQ